MILQRIFWSGPGLNFLRFAVGFGQRWTYAVMNRSLIAETNGENWLVSQLSSTPLIIDVGANKGGFSLEVLRQRPRARIVAFEPAQSMHPAFRGAIKEGSAVELVESAVGARKGRTPFFDTATGTSSLLDLNHPDAKKYDVPVVALDDFFEEHAIRSADFLKIDAEGSDLSVLEGATKLLSAQRIDIFAFEHNTPWIRSRLFLSDAVEFLSAKPYELFRLFNGFLAPFAYTHRAERHDLGCMYVGVSRDRLSRAPIPIKRVPGV